MNNFNNLNKEKLMGALENAAANQGLNSGEISDALLSGKMDKLLKSLNPAQAERLQGVLNNPQELNKILSSPQAAALLKKLK